MRNKDLEIKLQGKIDSFKGSFIEKAAIGASIVMPIKAAISFESAMADVKLAKITASGGALGVAKEKLMDFTTLVAKMSTAFDMSAEQAGITMAKIMNTYKLGLEEMQGLGDVMNHISDNSASSAKDIAEVLGRIGGTAQTMGLSAKNAAALGSAFLAMGKAPEVASTAINSFFSKIMAPEKQTADFKKALTQIGISAEELKDSIYENPQKAIEDFLQTLSEVERKEQMGVLSDLFGANFGDDMALLVCGLENYKKAVSLANDKNKVGSLQREFESRAATTENALTLFKSSVLNLGIAIGSVLLPPLNAIISVINPIINGFASLAEKFPKISGVVIGSVAAFGTFIVVSAGLGFVLNLVHLNLLKALPYFSLFGKAVMGSVAWIKAKNLGLLLLKARLGTTMVATKLYGIATLGLSKAIALSSVALKAFGSVLSFVGKSLLLNPIFLIGTLLAGVGYLIYKYWEPVKEIFGNLWEKIKIGAGVAWNFLKSFFKWSPLGLIIQNFSLVTEYFASLFATWISMFSNAISKIGSVISSIKGFFGFGEKSGNISLQNKSDLAFQSAQIKPIEIKLIPQSQKANMQNINVAFTGGIQVQTTDGKIPENSQLQRDIQREMEMALKKAKQSERDRSFSDLDF